MRERNLRLSTMLNRPLALDGRHTAEIRSALTAYGPHAPLASGPFDEADGGWGYGGVPLQVSGGVGIIPISGILLSGPGGWLYPMASFYEDIRARLDEAVEDDRIRAIALWIDSPGGVVSQCFELADHIYHAGSRSWPSSMTAPARRPTPSPVPRRRSRSPGPARSAPSGSS